MYTTPRRRDGFLVSFWCDPKYPAQDDFSSVVQHMWLRQHSVIAVSGRFVGDLRRLLRFRARLPVGLVESKQKLRGVAGNYEQGMLHCPAMPFRRQSQVGWPSAVLRATSVCCQGSGLERPGLVSATRTHEWLRHVYNTCQVLLQLWPTFPFNFQP